MRNPVTGLVDLRLPVYVQEALKRSGAYDGAGVVVGWVSRQSIPGNQWLLEVELNEPTGPGDVSYAVVGWGWVEQVLNDPDFEEFCLDWDDEDLV